MLSKLTLSNLTSSPRIRQVLSNVGWLSFDRLLRIASGVIVGVWVARYLGPDQYGAYNYALAYVSIFAAIAGMGLENVVIRDLVNDPERRGEVLGTSLVLKLVAASITVLAVLASISLLPLAGPQSFWLIVVVSATIVLQSFDVFQAWFQAEVKAKYITIARTCSLLTMAVVRVVLVLHQAPLIAFAWTVSIELALFTVLLLLSYWTNPDSVKRLHWNRPRAAQLLRDSWPFLLSNILVLIYMRIDQVMINHMVGDAEAGYYSAAVRLAELTGFLPQALVSTLFPTVVAAKAISEALFEERLRRLYSLVSLMSVGIALPMSLVANWAIVMAFGPNYAPAGAMLALLSWASLFSNLGTARGAYITAMNYNKLHMLCVLGGCLLNIGLNLLLIPRWGGVGAALASLIAYWFAAHGSCFLLPPLFANGLMMLRAMVMPRWK